MFQKILAAWILLTALAPQAFAKDADALFTPECEALLASTSLNVEQADSILTAAAGSEVTEFRVFTAIRDGRKRTVVVLGENHLAEQVDVDLARPVVDGFRAAATENGDTNYDLPYRYRSLPVAVMLTLPIVYFELSKPGKAGLSPMALCRNNPNVYSVESVEKGHRPSVAEEANIVALAGTELLNAAYPLTCTLGGFYGLMHMHEPAGALALGLAGGYALFARYLMPKILGWALPRMPIVYNRDRTMALNIDRMARRESFPEAMLVIVGKAHLPGIAARLTKDFGFDEVPLGQTAAASR